jgi:hypothetical protein
MFKMTGFDFYESLMEAHKDIEEKSLSDSELASLISNAKKSIRANCGELRRFSNPKAREALISFLNNGGVFETTFGKLVYGGKDGVNPLISALSECGHFGTSAKFYYTLATPLEQIFLGSAHAIVFDDGEIVFIEKPHGHEAENEQLGLLLYNEQELAESFDNFTYKNYEFREIKDVNDEVLAANTVEEGSSRWIEDDSYCTFNDKEEFMKQVLQKISA